MTPFQTAGPVPAAAPAAEFRGRLVPPISGSPMWGWAGPLLVTAFGTFLRFYRLGTPRAVVLHERYYVPDGYSILRHGVEINHVHNVNALLVRGSTNIFAAGGEFVVHPPLGKVAIAGGEWLFGLTPFGWRFAVAVIGSLSILMTARIARRMTRSTLLGCVAGLLLALDGLEFVLSRTAILDIFVMFWALAAFGLLIIDRDRTRARLGGAGGGGGGRAPRRAGAGGRGGGRDRRRRWPETRDPLGAGAGWRLPGLRLRVQVERHLVPPGFCRAGAGLGLRRPAGRGFREPRLRRAAQRGQVVSGLVRAAAARDLSRVLERLVRHQRWL